MFIHTAVLYRIGIRLLEAAPGDSGWYVSHAISTMEASDMTSFDINAQGGVLSGLLHGLSSECSGVRRGAVQVPHLLPHALETEARGVVSLTGLEADRHFSERDWCRSQGQGPGDGQRRCQQTTQNTQVRIRLFPIRF